ncbi:hypothetical protein [Pseudoalteromonas denitrificans]|jgi:hypothetical protein|uniref:Up-regulated in Daf-2 domain-containing protein n=1 Tax=Pseudoalteromonas denitrificans DSM 6059 TaxID=1123010 RepID=A0A1I1LZU9_9GAMM|nr:hypothetical protein [Pseudoalteromonas denitrificans]SFC78376.1 hypothetical protein SAMN02745724_02530 [Pseudoalteromonas denitrificans DSM 6059]
MSKGNLNVSITNLTGETIYDVSFLHNYKNDAYNEGRTATIEKGETIGVGEVTFWTESENDAANFWWVQFEHFETYYASQLGKFNCELTIDDKTSDGAVRIIVTLDEMTVTPPVSDPKSTKIKATKR